MTQQTDNVLVWVLIAIGVLSGLGFLGGSGNCHTDWDGRSNPTVCE